MSWSLISLRPAAEDRSVKATSFRRGKLEAHFEKHRGEWPFRISKAEYERGARDLLRAPSGRNILGHTRANGDILRYDKAKNVFACMAPDGKIRTCFRPAKKIHYWNEEIAK